MNNIQQKINEIQTNGYNLDFSEVFNAALENYKKIALNAGLALLLFSIVLGVFGASIVGGIFGFSSFSSTLTNFNLVNFSAVGIFGYLLSVVIIAAITAPFNAGIIKMAFLADENQEFSLANAFDYYKGNYFKELFLAALLVALITVSLNMLLEYTNTFLVGKLLTYVISFFTLLINPLIIFGNLKAVDAIKASFMIVSKQIPVLLALVIVAIIISCLGIIGLCIGVFFTIPFIFSVYFMIYKQIFGIATVSEIEEIGSFQE